MGVRPETFFYPMGSANSDARSEVERAGYRFVGHVAVPWSSRVWSMLLCDWLYAFQSAATILPFASTPIVTSYMCAVP